MAYKRQTNILLASIILGIIMLIVDFIAHNTIGNSETFYYYLAKPIIASYVAFLIFTFRRKFKKINGVLYYVFWATMFALVHGIYYRVLELIQGKELFYRVGIVELFGFTFNTLPEMIFAWWIIHAGAFLIGLIIVKLIFRKL